MYTHVPLTHTDTLFTPRAHLHRYAEGQPASAWIDNRSAPRTPDYNASCPDFHWTVAHQVGRLTLTNVTETDTPTPGVNFRRQSQPSRRPRQTACSVTDGARPCACRCFPVRHVSSWDGDVCNVRSVDDGVAGIVATVEDLGIQNRTYFFVTSDHGYTTHSSRCLSPQQLTTALRWNLGQHRLPGGKHNVYDHSTRIPMVIRGPGECRAAMRDGRCVCEGVTRARCGACRRAGEQRVPFPGVQRRRRAHHVGSGGSAMPQSCIPESWKIFPRMPAHLRALLQGRTACRRTWMAVRWCRYS